MNARKVDAFSWFAVGVVAEILFRNFSDNKLVPDMSLGIFLVISITLFQREIHNNYIYVILSPIVVYFSVSILPDVIVSFFKIGRRTLLTFNATLSFQNLPEADVVFYYFVSQHLFHITFKVSELWFICSITHNPRLAS